MKKGSLELRLILSAIGLVLILGVVGMLLPKSKTAAKPNSLMPTQDFSDKYLVAVYKDSLDSALKAKYGDMISSRMLKKYSVELKNQGTMLSNFYNDNNKMLELKSQGFDIKKVQNNTIVATFDTLTENNKIYVKVPTDVLYGLLAN